VVSFGLRSDVVYWWVKLVVAQWKKCSGIFFFKLVFVQVKIELVQFFYLPTDFEILW